MRVLLDTQALLWAASAPERMTEPARRAIEAGANDVFVSSVSIWEIAIKSQAGRLRLERTIEDSVPYWMSEGSFLPLPVVIPHALKVASLPDIHRDPFDRMLVAQAIVEDLHLVSADLVLRRYPVKVVW